MQISCYPISSPSTAQKKPWSTWCAWPIGFSRLFSDDRKMNNQWICSSYWWPYIIQPRSSHNWNSWKSCHIASKFSNIILIPLKFHQNPLKSHEWKSMKIPQKISIKSRENPFKSHQKSSEILWSIPFWMMVVYQSMNSNSLELPWKPQNFASWLASTGLRKPPRPAIVIAKGTPLPASASWKSIASIPMIWYSWRCWQW